MKKLLVISLFFLKSYQIHAMQSKAKTKPDFDAALFQQKLKLLPSDLQKYAIYKFLWHKMPNIINSAELEVDSEVLVVDYRLIPAFFDNKIIKSLHNMIWTVQFGKNTNLYDQGRDIKIIQFKGYQKTFSFHHFNLGKETQYLRDNHDKFVILGYKDKIQTYIHDSHKETLNALSLEQLNFISDLYKTQAHLNKETERKRYGQFPITLNEQQLRLFYSLPAQVQNNLKANYCLKAPFTIQLAVKFSRFARLRTFYSGYDSRLMVRLAKIITKAGLTYWLLKRAITSKDFKDRHAALVISRLLTHKKKFILGTAVLIGLQAKLESVISATVAKRMPKVYYLARKTHRLLMPHI